MAYKYIRKTNPRQCCSSIIITNEINNTLTITLNELKNGEIIDEKLYKFLHCSTDIAPKFYGLPKIHQPNCPLRPITSFINSPIYNLAKLLSKSFQKIVGHTECHIKDSFEFKKKISNIYIPNNFTLVSRDAVSMYTNISWNLIRKSVKHRWNQIKIHTFLKQTHFDNILQFCLESSYCTFNNDFYKQIFVMEKIENFFLKKPPYDIILYYRYVDDTLIYLPEEEAGDLLCRFNSMDKKLKFTLEKSNNNNINFLDLNIQIINNKIITNWYRKLIWSGRYINFFSNHNLSHKIGIIYSLTDRAILLSEKIFHIENLSFVRSTLLRNEYPLNLLNEKIFERYKDLIFNTIKSHQRNDIDENNYQEERKIITFPYIQNFQEQLCRI